MREIKEVAGFINDEVDGVLEYAKAAVFYKDKWPTLAATYNKLATTELQHVQLLHAEAAKLIQSAENKNIQYPQSMRDTWDKQHKEAIEKMAEAKKYLDMFK